MVAGRPTILYVDDENNNRVVFLHSFRDYFPVAVAACAEEAFEILKRETVGVVVSDQRMPRLTGNEFLERVKDLYPDTIRIVITAYSDLDPILRAVNDGLVARYIIKPWDFAELLKILQWAIEAYSLGQNNSALQLRLLQTERLVTVGSIGSAILHDINQPVAYLLANTDRLAHFTTVMGQLGALAERHRDELDPTGQKLLSELSEELGEIVQDMAKGCRVIRDISSGLRRILNPNAMVEGATKTEAMPVVQYALSVCRHTALAAHAALEYDGPVDLPAVTVSFAELAQILINLISNAAQAIERTGRRGHITLHAAARQDHVQFVVEDDGPGMDDATLRQVGTLFFTTRSEGTGLGVAQCRRLVEGAGGAFEIQSKPDEGTTVRFTVHTTA